MSAITLATEKQPPPNIPIAFAAPARQALFKAYGDPRAEGSEAKRMQLWEVTNDFTWFPKAQLYLHREFLPLLRAAFTDLAAANLHTEIKTCDGAFNIRHVRGSYSVLSVHSWGCALDMNARDNPPGSAGKWCAAFLKVMTQHKIFCGQLWNGRKDPMRFTMVNG